MPPNNRFVIDLGGGLKLPIRVYFHSSNMLGCHTNCLGNFYGSVELDPGTFPAIATKLGGKRNFGTTFADTPDGVVKKIQLDVFNAMDEYLKGNLMVLMSDRLSRVEHQILCPSTLVKWLVKERGWGCTASPAGLNPSYEHQLMPSFCQSWILLNPLYSKSIAWDSGYEVGFGTTTLNDLYERYKETEVVYGDNWGGKSKHARLSPQEIFGGWYKVRGTKLSF